MPHLLHPRNKGGFVLRPHALQSGENVDFMAASSVCVFQRAEYQQFVMCA